MVFSSSTPGLTSTMLAAGTYNLFAAGGSGGVDYYTGLAGGLGAAVSTTITIYTPQTISVLVGGAGAYGSDGGGGGGASFLVDSGNQPLLIAGGGGGGVGFYFNGGGGGGGYTGGNGGSADPAAQGGGGGTSFSAGSDSTYALAARGNGGVGIRLVSLAAVPEPATWAMMIVGFGAVGASLRRRRAMDARVRYA